MNQKAPLEIGLPVRDLETMVAFYKEVFSCQELRRADIPAELSSRVGIAENGYVNVWLQFPGGEIIKLLHPPEPPQEKPAERYLATRTGIRFFTLYCDDVAAAVSSAVANGAELITERVLMEGGVGAKLAFLRDPEGNVFEFVEA